MKTLFISYCTEYEAGWGQRPDGIIISPEKAKLLAAIERSTAQGSYEIFWRYSEPQEIFCDTATYAEITAKLNVNGIYHTDKIDNTKFYKHI